jgi:Cytosine/adenosine deaminases
MDKHLAYINEAIQLAAENVHNGGGPFGAVIVKDGETIARSGNTVTQSNDPTAHAEVNVIREACRRLETFHLEGCAIYTSCEPCPMCLSAIYWARISEVYYAASREDAAESGFDDSLIYEEIAKPLGKRTIPFIQMEVEETAKPFRIWREYEKKTHY